MKLICGIHTEVELKEGDSIRFLYYGNVIDGNVLKIVPMASEYIYIVCCGNGEKAKIRKEDIM